MKMTDRTIKPDTEFKIEDVADFNDELLNLYKSAKGPSQKEKKSQPTKKNENETYLQGDAQEVNVGSKKLKGYIPVAGQNASLGGYAQVGMNYGGHMSVEQALAKAAAAGK